MKFYLHLWHNVGKFNISKFKISKSFITKIPIILYEKSKNFFYKTKNKSDFNGNVLISRVKFDKLGNMKFKLIPSKFALYKAMLSRKIPTKHNLSGTIAIVVTQDHKIIIGSRNSRQNENEIDEIQFPCGYHDSNSEQLQNLNDIYKNNRSFDEFCISEGLREVREELYNFHDDQISMTKALGFLTNKIEKYEYMNSFIVLYKIDIKFDELLELRTKFLPADSKEMKVIGYMELSDIRKIIKNKGKFYFAKKERNFTESSYLAIKILDKYFKNFRNIY